MITFGQIKKKSIIFKFDMREQTLILSLVRDIIQSPYYPILLVYGYINFQLNEKDLSKTTIYDSKHKVIISTSFAELLHFIQNGKTKQFKISKIWMVDPFQYNPIHSREYEYAYHLIGKSQKNDKIIMSALFSLKTFKQYKLIYKFIILFHLFRFFPINTFLRKRFLSKMYI